MLNPLEAYADAGRKCAQARKQNDEPTAQSWSTYYVRMINLERVKDKKAAEKAYTDAYKVVMLPHVAGK